MESTTSILTIEQAAILGYTLMIDRLVHRRAALAHQMMEPKRRDRYQALPVKTLVSQDRLKRGKPRR